ncbi:mannose-1-phosphate guanyltransferase [Thermohalobacter berrensis]|nr:mannose-1-phosphate guanyltransferase [Thermohalobacter berrensis]
MAGGKGTRLRPLTCDIPKPMVPILNKPVMEYIINLLKKHDINDIAVTMAYFPSVITDYFGDGQEWGVNLNYFIEDVPLGTGGSVKNAEEILDDTFVVISGDALTDINLREAIKFHKDKNSKATLVLKKESVPLEYGVIITDDEGRIVRFLEKPSWGEVFSDTINTGIYILEPEVLDYYKKGDNFDFSKDLFPKLLRDKVPMYGYVTDDYWCDIGNLNTYKLTQYDILNGKVNVDLSLNKVEEGIWIGEGTKLGRNVKIIPPVYIGKNCIIKDNVNIEPYTIIGHNCHIEKNTSLKRSIIWNNSRIGKKVEGRGTVICNNVHVNDRAKLFEGSAVGVGSIVSSNVVIKPNIKIWPDKKIEENTIVKQNLIWGTKASKTLFGYRDISGNINIDITPEFATRLGSAFASIMDDESTIIVSSDNSSASNIIKNCIASGILSTGVGVIDINNTAMPMNRFAVRHYKANGGIHVRIDYSNKNKVHIEFVDKNGANIGRSTERKIENIFNREDFERCNGDKVKDVIKIQNFASFYIKNGGDLLKDISQIKRKNPKVIISSRSQNIISLAKMFLEYIGCEVNTEYSIEKYNSVDEYFSFLSKQVKDKKADMGIIFSENGENIILIDDKGRVIDKEKYIAVISLITLKIGNIKKLVIPYNSPKVIEEMARKYDVDVIRTKSNPSNIINRIFEISDKNSLIQYILNFDGIWGTGKIIDFLIQNETSLSKIADEVPNFHYVREEIACDWKDKGRVIREVIEENKDKDIELFEGVKINDNRGWALILPDSEKPVFNIYAEGFSEEYAQELSTFYSEKVKKLLKNQGQ